MKKTLFNEDWYFKYNTIGSKPADISPQKINLPHDAVISLDCSEDGDRKKGFYPNVFVLYSKELYVEPEWKGEYIALQFDGVYQNSKVFVNGVYAGGNRCGYDRFFVEIHALLKYGAKNLISVEADTSCDSRWYSGAGIYRNVYLLRSGKIHFCPGKIKINTEHADGEEAALTARMEIKNEDILPCTVNAEIEFRDENGDIACVSRRKVTLKEQAVTCANWKIYMDAPKLWDPDNPHMYECTVKLLDGDKTVDEEQFRTGIRTLSLGKRKGFCINGTNVRLYGGCIHHDNGIIGSAAFKGAEYRKIRMLREAGYNAIRCSHNPMSEELMDACDKYGMLVMAELTDMWNYRKSNNDFSRTFADDWEKSAEMLVDVCFNHPSVVMYSVGNEIKELGRADGKWISRMLANRFRKLDSTRYVTAGINAMLTVSPGASAIPEEKKSTDINTVIFEMMDKINDMQCADAVVAATEEAGGNIDIVGYNYAEDKQLLDMEKYTDWICVGSETFPRNIAKNWEMVEKYPNILGDFSWTSWDYLGEPGIGRNRGTVNKSGDIYEVFPYKLSNCGDFDITGYRRPQSFYRECVVGHRTKPFLAVKNMDHDAENALKTPWSWPDVVSSWSWKGHEGEAVSVEVYGMGDEVELIVNGKSVGRKSVRKKSEGKLLAGVTVFDTVYEPGYVEAVLYRDGKEAGRHRVNTAEDELEIRICEEQGNEWQDIRFFEIKLTDKSGELKTDCDRKIKVTVEGDGKLQGFGSAFPYSTENFTDGEYTTFYGKALLAVRPSGSGKIKVTAETSGADIVSKEF